MEFKKVSKVVGSPKVPVRLSGKHYEPGDIFSVTSEDTIGVLGNSADPHRYFFQTLALPGDHKAYMASVGEIWQSCDSEAEAKEVSGWEDFNHDNHGDEDDEDDPTPKKKKKKRLLHVPGY